MLLEVGYGNFFSSPGVNDHHARVVRGGDGQGEGGGAPGGGVWKFFTSFNEETRSTAPRAPLICPSLDLYREKMIMPVLSVSRIKIGSSIGSIVFAMQCCDYSSHISSYTFLFSICQ